MIDGCIKKGIASVLHAIPYEEKFQLPEPNDF
jgi:hypothetical protein